jgi:outer membrane protein assembly factor BamE
MPGPKHLGKPDSHRSDSNMKRLTQQILLISLCSTLLACNNIGSMDFPGVYKISIPQGNVITQDMVDQLRPGMSKRQVTFVMGTPLVRDPFHQDRWDYIYSFQPGGGERGQERISVFFVDDQLVSFEGDFVPSELAELSTEDASAEANN